MGKEGGEEEVPFLPLSLKRRSIRREGEEGEEEEEEVHSLPFPSGRGRARRIPFTLSPRKEDEEEVPSVALPSGKRRRKRPFPFLSRHGGGRIGGSFPLRSLREDEEGDEGEREADGGGGGGAPFPFLFFPPGRRRIRRRRRGG